VKAGAATDQQATAQIKNVSDRAMAGLLKAIAGKSVDIPAISPAVI